MDDFEFFEGTNCFEQTTSDDDPIAQYFKIRQRYRQESLGSSRGSSVSLLSLNKTSFLGEPAGSGQEKTIRKLSLNDDFFKKPKTPPMKLKKPGFDFLVPTFSPQTPRFFQDELSSMTPDITSSINVRNGSLADFPLRDGGEILDRLEKDEKKFVANTSGFSHNSDITHFSDANRGELSVGEFFANRCHESLNFGAEKENSPPKERHTLSEIHDLLSAEDLSGTLLCEKLLRKGKNMTIGPKINLSESRHSTPLAAGENLTSATPLRKGREWIRRGPLNASTPQNDAQHWRQLRQTQIEDLDQTNVNSTITQNTPHTPKRDILNVIKKLKDLPMGAVDCSAMAPLVKDEFPQLLGEFEPPDVKSDAVLSTDAFRVPTDPLSVSVCVSAKQLVPVGIGSREKWLLVRLFGVEVIAGGQNMRAELRENTFVTGDLIFLRAKDVVLPPNTQHVIHLSIICKKMINAALRITLQATDVHHNTTVKNSFVVFLSAISPSTAFQATPLVDFGTIPENCHDDRTVKLTYNGECAVPLSIYLPEDIPFKFTRNVSLNGQPFEGETTSEKCFLFSLEKGKQVLEFGVQFHPSDVPRIEEKRIVDFGGEISVDLKTATGENVAKIRLQGSAAYAKFLCRSDCSPVVFHATDEGVKTTKPFYVKNVGAIALKVGLTVAADPASSENDEQFFTVPQMVIIPLNETVSFDIVFHPRFGETCVRRFLIMRLEPNDKITYDVELIGMLAGPAVRLSKNSLKTASSLSLAGGLAVKLSSTDNALSWMATPLQKSVLKTFQVKLKCETGVHARMSLSPGAFTIMNEKGEAMSKVRKTLKPGVPVSIAVQFKPDSIGLHLNQLAFEFNSESYPSTINLIGFGGCPKLRVEDTLLDLHGNKMVKLSHPRGDGFIYTAQFRITNYGNVAGFVLISPFSNVLSVAHSLKVYPLQSVLEPNTNVIINLSQHLTRHEFRDILAKQDIRKLATLSVVMGDEPSRQRLRKYLSAKTDYKSEGNKQLIQEFPNEKKINLDGIKESKDFEACFLNSISTCDVVAVVEKTGCTVDQTVIDLDESSCSFETLSQTVIVQQLGAKAISEHSVDTRQRRKSPNSSYQSGNSHDTTRKVHDWLRKVE